MLNLTRIECWNVSIKIWRLEYLFPQPILRHNFLCSGSPMNRHVTEKSYRSRRCNYRAFCLYQDKLMLDRLLSQKRHLLHTKSP